MGGIMGKPKTPQSVIDAERRAKEAEEKALRDEEQGKVDAKYRLEKQRGKASTVLLGDESSAGSKMLSRS